MARTQAWHLRRDGKLFPVQVHLYIDDADEESLLSSASEIAAFIVSTKTNTNGLAEKVLDMWMASIIEDVVKYDDTQETINQKIIEQIHRLPYHHQYRLSDKEYIGIHNQLGNYSDVDSYYDFYDEELEDVEETCLKLSDLFNNLFCRVRYGGQYDSDGIGEIWYRISSTDGFNWANVIYITTTTLKRQMYIQYISVCRDNESDNGFGSGGPEKFYRAKDGTFYHHMSLDEYLTEEHEHSVYFESVSNQDYKKYKLLSVFD